MSYAVVDLGGKQYRVEEGSVITVDRLQAEQGDKVTLRPVMFRGDDVVLDAEGDIVAMHNGALDEQGIRDLVAELDADS